MKRYTLLYIVGVLCTFMKFIMGLCQQSGKGRKRYYRTCD